MDQLLRLDILGSLKVICTTLFWYSLLMFYILFVMSESYHRDWTSRNEKTLLDYVWFYSFFRLINFSICDITTLTPLLFGVEMSFGSKLFSVGSSMIYFFIFCLNENLFKANLAFWILLLFTRLWLKTYTFWCFRGKFYFLIWLLGF